MSNELTPDWNKVYYVNDEEAKILSDLGLGFDQSWSDDTRCIKHWYGRRLPELFVGGKHRIHQDSIEAYESLNPPTLPACDLLPG